MRESLGGCWPGVSEVRCSGIGWEGFIQGGKWIKAGLVDDPRSNGVVMNVVDPFGEVVRVDDAAVVVASLPDICLAVETEGEAALDVLHGLFQRSLRRGREHEVEVVRHDDKGVEFDASLGALVLQNVDEEQCGLFDLKESAARGGDCGDEVGADLLRGRTHGRKDTKARG